MRMPDRLKGLLDPSEDPRWAAAHAEGRRAALLELADVAVTREALRQAMNDAMRDEFGAGAAEIPAPHVPDPDGDYALDQQRLTRVASHLAAGYLTRVHQEARQ
jgi:hypothetical protein